MKMALTIKKLLLVGETIFGLILVLVIVVSVFPLIPPFKNYYHSRTVLTGSMEPKIPKGSVVINQWTDQKNLKVGDVIAYQHPSDKKIIYITHRIVKIDKNGLLWRFETKGDANPASDFGMITQAGIEGKVIFTIPLIGYLIEFFKTPVGFILLVALPLLLYIVKETKGVLQLWQKRAVPQDQEDVPAAKLKGRKPSKRKDSKPLLTVILIALAFLAARISFVTYASFTSRQATITGVTLSTATSFPGDVVINEIMWMGSANSEHLGDDEWIELRNTTGRPIDLKCWKIYGTGSKSFSITLCGIIPANGFFLLSHYSSSHSAIKNSISIDQVNSSLSLDNCGEQLTLKSNLNVIIDQTPFGAWAAGVNGKEKQSMERNDDPATGWHTCRTAACHSITYWDVDGHNWGTPKSANLSENDSISLSPLPFSSPTSELSFTPSSASPAEPESSPSPSSTPIPEVSPTPTPSPTLEISPTPTPTIEPSPTLEPSTTPTLSPSPQPLSTASLELSPSPSPQSTSTPAPTSEPTPTLIPTPSPTSE
jgi:signal peptidase I